jgi:integrase
VYLVDDQPGIHGFITIDRGKSKHSRRTVPLTKAARTILERQKSISKSHFVFVRVGNRVDKYLWYMAPISRFTVSEQFSKRRDELGLPWDAVLHSTRHTAGTDLGAAGANAFTIQKFLGHSSVTISQRYVHPGDPAVLASIQQLELHREREAKTRQPQLVAVERAAGT